MKVLILLPEKPTGVIWYRLKQFATITNRNSWLDVKFLDVNLPEDQLSQVISEADAYITRLNDTVAFDLFDIIRSGNQKKPIFVDIDDNYECVDPLSDMYEAYGMQDVQLQDGTYLWKDGSKRFDIKRNKKRLSRFKDIMREATGIICTTFKLREYATQYNDNVVVIPNAIDFDYFPDVKDNTKNKNEIRLLWAGGSSHYPDLVEIKKPLENLMTQNPNLHFYMVGVGFKGIVKDLPLDRVHIMPWVHANGHGYRLACIDADIAIAPLKEMEFNYYKSSVKYYEYSALKIPTIAKDIEPYCDDIIHDKTGLLYNTPDEFQASVQALINNPIKRIQYAKNAYEHVQNNRSIHGVTYDWSYYIQNVIEACKSQS